MVHYFVDVLFLFTGLITLDEMKRRQEEIFRVRDQLLATGKYGDGNAVLDAAARLAFDNRAASSAASSSAYVISIKLHKKFQFFSRITI